MMTFSGTTIYGVYRIMYRIKDDEIWVTGVVHGAQNWKGSL